MSSKPATVGFTLIELLVAMSLIGVIFSLGLAEYQKFNRRQVLVQAAEELKNNLRLAQNKALAGEKPSDWCDDPGQVLLGHRLRFSSTTRYLLEAVCSAPEEPAYLLKTVDLPGQGEITGPSGTSVLFKVLAQGVVVSGGPAEIVLSGFGEERTVSVSETGEIK